MCKADLNHSLVADLGKDENRSKKEKEIQPFEVKERGREMRRIDEE
jgi:hypothetical protein